MRACGGGRGSESELLIVYAVSTITLAPQRARSSLGNEAAQS